MSHFRLGKEHRKFRNGKETEKPGRVTDDPLIVNCLENTVQHPIPQPPSPKKTNI